MEGGEERAVSGREGVFITIAMVPDYADKFRVY